MSNAAEMDAQEIINYIATAPKKTPVKLYVREKPGMKVAWGDAHVYGGRRGKTVFGDWDELKAILDANADSIDCYDVENDCRNSAVPMLDLKGINARIEPGAIIRDLDLRRPIYEKTAAYGHFGREDPDFTWEKTDRVEELKAACGL